MSVRQDCADAMPAGLINLPVHSLSQRGVLLQWQERLIELRYLNESYSNKSLQLPSPSTLGHREQDVSADWCSHPSLWSVEATKNPTTTNFAVVLLRLQLTAT